MVRDHDVHTVLRYNAAEWVSSAFLVWGNKEAPVKLHESANMIFIGEQKLNEETLSAPRQLPRVSVVPKNAQNEKDNRQQGN